MTDNAVTASQQTKGESSYYYAHKPRGDAQASGPAVTRKPLSPASVQALREREQAAKAKAVAAGCGQGSAANALLSNQWHWEEKDLSKEVTKRLRAALVGAATDGVAVVVKARGSTAKAAGDGACYVKTLDVTGDMYCNTRKAKRLFGYDLALTVRWRATASAAADAFAVAGTLTVNNIAEDSDPTTFVVDGVGEYEQVSEQKTDALDGCALDRLLRQRKILHKHMKAKLLKRVLQKVHAVCKKLEAEHTTAAAPAAAGDE